jgi:hypothetical protein
MPKMSMHSKTLWLWVALFCSAVGGWALQYVALLTPLQATIVATIAFIIAYYAIKKSESLTSSNNIGSKKRLTTLEKLKPLLEKIEIEYDLLGDKAIIYPLVKYENEYLLAIDEYDKAKKANMIKPIMDNNTLIIKGLIRYYRDINPYLADLENTDMKINPKSFFKKLKDMQEQTKDMNLGQAINRFQQANRIVETIKILMGLHHLNRVMLSPEDITTMDSFMNNANDKFFKAKQKLYRRINNNLRKEKVWITIWG